MLHSGIPQNFNWLQQSQSRRRSLKTSSGDGIGIYIFPIFIFRSILQLPERNSLPCFCTCSSGYVFGSIIFQLIDTTYLLHYVTGSHLPHIFSCPSNVHWNDDGLEKDLYIQTTTVTVLAMDGRRRWLDIHKLVSFIFNFGNSDCFYSKVCN